MSVDIDLFEYMELMNYKIMYWEMVKAIYAAYCGDPEIEQVGSEILYRIYTYVIMPEIEKLNSDS